MSPHHLPTAHQQAGEHMTKRLRSACSDCGTPYERDTTKLATCPDCRPADRADETDRPSKLRRLDDRGTRQARGYGAEWDRLSVRARRLQPWCTDCGSPDDLTADHSPEAWRRHERGQRIRLRDIDVVCRGCNAARGAARGPNTRDRHTNADTYDALDYAARLVRGPLTPRPKQPATSGNKFAGPELGPLSSTQGDRGPLGSA